MLALKPFVTIGPQQKESRLGIFLSQVEYTRMSSDPSQRDVKKKKVCSGSGLLSFIFMGPYVKLPIQMNTTNPRN